jgi:divalent metal cation (Fe/Co/Zn/Cd) transporter
MLLLGLTVALKLVLWLWCTHVAQTTHNVTIISLAQDALNDVLSNAVSLVSAALTLIRPELWLSDPIGAILIGGYIILTWYSFSPTHPFLPYVAPHFSHISHFILAF